MMDQDELDDALMLRYKAGDYDAFKALYARHGVALYRYIAWQAPVREWADEITQDTWLRLHHSRESYTPQAHFKAFLYQIARNRLLDMRRQKRMVFASELVRDDEDGQEDVFGYLAENAFEVAASDIAISDKQRNKQLHGAIAALPKLQKEALIAHYFSELTLEEIAMLTDVGVETVKSRLRYAMQKLREQLN